MNPNIFFLFGSLDNQKKKKNIFTTQKNISEETALLRKMSEPSNKNETKNEIQNLIKQIQQVKNRPNWDEYFICNAYLISKRSTCAKLHVGCVLTKDNRIISTGYNGHVAGCAHTSKIVDGHEQMTIHAEANAICHNNTAKTKGCIAYITHYPCLNCAKLLIAAGISTIVYAEDYNNNKIFFLI